MAEKITISLDVEVTDQNIDDIMVTALEGGINYWCNKAVVVNNDYRGNKYASGVISRNGTLLLCDSEDSKEYELDRTKFIKGLKMFLQESSSAHCLDGNDLDTGMVDADDADAIIQYALFDDIIYG